MVHTQVMHPSLRVAALSPPATTLPSWWPPSHDSEPKYHHAGCRESAEDPAALERWRWGLTPSGEAGGKGTGDGMELAHDGATWDSLGEETPNTAV